MSGAQPAGCISGRAAGARDGPQRDRRRSSRGSAPAPGTANCARRARRSRRGLAALERHPGGGGTALGRGQCRRTDAAIHALRDRGAPARVRRGAALRVGIHFRDAGDRRGLLAFRRAHRTAGRAHAQHRQSLRLSRPRRGSFCRRHAGAAGSRASRASSSRPARRCSRRAAGRAFLLYTSYRGLAEGVRARRRASRSRRFRCWCKGEAPREALLNRFRELGNAVLLATGSFWEGVDVKGEALSIVAIDKLPFASPDDPLLKARLEGIRRRGGNPFYGVSIAAGGAGVEAGSRPPDPRLRRFRRDRARRSAPQDQGLWAACSSNRCRRAR